MDPLLLVIVSFGLGFVVLASLAQGFATTLPVLRKGLGIHSQLDVMLLISNFVALPALLIGLASVIHFDPQVKMAIIVLAITAGAPFIPWLVSKGKGDVGYSALVSIGLTVVSLILVPLLLPPLLRLLDTGASPAIWTVAWPLLLVVALPLVGGISCRAR